ncbi:hypothetical protein AVEN_217235-1 [Araneus ventricosus]|uniref:Uncharacterized protein n=1 Tax=Araneus ventricosus TaxID=182803 RepID=A0A4Y2J6V3_ARAVE|nr:hypothetical protein AVEN_217235-1 [Araneus ventricosus]
MSHLYSSGGEETQEPSHGRNGPLGTWKFSRWSPRSTIVRWSQRKAELHPLSIYLLLTMPTTYEKEMERLRKLLAEVEIDEDPDFGNVDNGSEDVLKEIFSDHQSFCEHDTE